MSSWKHFTYTKLYVFQYLLLNVWFIFVLIQSTSVQVSIELYYKLKLYEYVHSLMNIFYILSNIISEIEHTILIALYKKSNTNE